MARYKTFTNGGSVLPADLNAIQDDYEYTFSGYKSTYLFGSFNVPAGTTAATRVFPLNYEGTLSTVSASAEVRLYARYLTPADFAAGTRTVKARTRVAWVTNATAPGITFTFGLYPISAFASGAFGPHINTLGTVTSGSTVAIATPGANSNGVSVSSDFNMPTAGWYALGVVTSGTTAASSVYQGTVFIDRREV